MTDHGGAASPRTEAEELAAMRARHVDTLSCGFPIHEDGTSERPPFDGVCGYARRDAIHDLYPDVSKRDRLPTLMTERDRHAFVVGEPCGICEYDRTDWPCDAAVLLEAAQEAPVPEGLRRDLANCEPWTDATGAVVGQKVPEWLVLRLLAAAPPTPAEPPNPERWHPPVGPDDVTPCHCGKFGHLPPLHRAEAHPPEPCPDHDPNSGPGSDQCPNCGRYAEPPRPSAGGAE